MDRKIFPVILVSIFIILFAAAFQAQASKEKRVVRVGVDTMPRYQEIGPDGKAKGFVVDLLTRISKETGWKIEYVQMPGWDDAMNQLANGKIDLLSPAFITAERLKRFLFSASPIGHESVTIMVLRRSELEASDIPKMKIAIEQGTIHGDTLRDYARRHGYSILNVVTYPGFAQMRKDLEAGKIDAVVTDAVYGDSGMRTIATLKNYSYYFMVNNKDRDLADELDEALNAVDTNDPMFRMRTFNKYFGQLFEDTLTAEEKKCVAARGIVKIGVPDDRKPMFYRDKKTGELTGIGIEIMNAVGKYTGLKFQYISAGSMNDEVEALASGKYDIVMPVPNSMTSNANGPLWISTPFIQANAAIVTIPGKEIKDITRIKIGITKGISGMLAQYRKAYPEMKLTEYDSWPDAIKGLRRGEVEGLLNNSFNWSVILQKPSYSDLKVIPSSTNPIYICAAGFRNSGNRMLFRIIDKAINNLSDDEKFNIVTLFTTSAKMYDYTLSDIVYENRWILLFIITVVCGVIFGTLLYTRQKDKYARVLEHKNEELVMANSAKSDFLSRMSHDIRTPMNGIIGMTNLALDEIEDAKAVGYFKKIKHSSSYLLGLINDVLEMSRIESGKVELARENSFIGDYVNSVTTVIRPQIDAKKIDFSFDIKENVPRNIYTDALRLNRVVINLVSNAVKFTPENGKIIVTIENLTPEDKIHCRCRVTVSDNGRGMSEEFMKHCFDPFTQEKSSESGGTGLGLSIVKKLVNMLGGEISVTSTPGKGTSFSFEFACDIAPALPGQGDETSRHISASVSALGRRILLAEDNDINREIAVALLEKKGYTVDVAEDGRQAVDKFAASEENSFDAVLMDIRMPVMDGLEAARNIRAMKRGDAKDVPIIAMTANAFDEDVQASMDAGMNVHLAKPIDPDLMYDAIEHEIITRHK